jgi:hypothetical protein
MARRVTLTSLSVRLLTAPQPLDAAQRATRPCVYRPLMVGPAILERARGPGRPWRVRLASGHPLLPLSPCTPRAFANHLLRLHDRGLATRLTAALLAPIDVPRVAGDLAALFRHRSRRPAEKRLDIYGWALMYRIDASAPFGLVDPHDEHPDLPACYESPEELADRAEFLEARGMATRPLAVITQVQDFDIAADGLPRNRYCDAATWRRAGEAGIFVGD